MKTNCNCAVLNPAICLSWIKRHWETKFIAKAESNLRDLVGLVFIFVNGVSSSVPKMTEYREKSDTSEDVAESAQNTTDHGSGYVPRHMSLAAVYNIEEEMDTGSIGESVQTVEQEYQAYITGALSMKTVDILKYWEVNSDAM